MAKSIWPHHISCPCQVCEMRRQGTLPTPTRREWWDIIAAARRHPR